MKQTMKFDFILFIVVLLLVVIGTSMIFSASNFKANEKYNDSNYYLKKQLVRVLMGLIMMIMFFYIDYHDLQKFSWIFLLISVVLLVYVLFNGAMLNGSRRSFFFMSFMFQPSEAAKFSLILFLSQFLVKKRKRIKNFFDGLVPVLLIIVLVIFPIVLEPDLGTSIIIIAISGIMLYVGGVNLFHLSTLGLSFLGLFTLLLSIFSYQRIRFFQFIDTVRGIREPPWQVLQSLICFANGGFWGLGLGNSRQKFHFLPQPFTDFIYSIIAEEAGILGAVFVLILFLIFLWRGIAIALNAPDEEGKLLAIGITTSIIIYAFANIAIVINLMPITGIPLPFISYGGSALIMNFMAVGILLNISSQSSRKSARAGVNYSTKAVSQMYSRTKVTRTKRKRRVGK